MLDLQLRKQPRKLSLMLMKIIAISITTTVNVCSRRTPAESVNTLTRKHLFVPMMEIVSVLNACSSIENSLEKDPIF